MEFCAEGLDAEIKIMDTYWKSPIDFPNMRQSYLTLRSAPMISALWPQIIWLRIRQRTVIPLFLEHCNRKDETTDQS